MTPQQFIDKWRGVELKERSASQSHFNDLCALLGVLDPVAADPQGEWFTFEKGASKTSGGDGWADVWQGLLRLGVQGQAQGPRRGLRQLLHYAVALENPPLLVVSDMDRIRIHTNWTNTVQEIHEFALDDLLDAGEARPAQAAVRRPRGAEAEARPARQLTEEAAARVRRPRAAAARARPRRRTTVAHFVNRLVFCMFAEDVGLLPDHLFTQMLEVSRPRPDELRGECAHAVRRDGAQGRQGRLRRAIDWFNGGLFDDDDALPVSTRRHRRADRGRAAATGRRSTRRSSARCSSAASTRQAQPARRALHRPRQDHDDRPAGDHRAARRRMGRGAGADRPALVEAAAPEADEGTKLLRGAERAEAHASATPRPRRSTTAFIERLADVPRARSGLRLGQLPLSSRCGR